MAGLFSLGPNWQWLYDATKIRRNTPCTRKVNNRGEQESRKPEAVGHIARRCVGAGTKDTQGGGQQLREVRFNATPQLFHASEAHPLKWDHVAINLDYPKKGWTVVTAS
jgi:hypothetical protein